MRLFDAACLSILLYGCESWLLSKTLTNKLDVYARKCYRIMLNINQKKDHITNEALYKMAGNQRKVNEMVRERQLQFTGHCLRLSPDEPANIYMLYQYNIRTEKHQRQPRLTYTKQIANHICSDKTGVLLTADEIVKYAKNKSDWKKIIAAPKKPDRWWWWWWKLHSSSLRSLLLSTPRCPSPCQCPLGSEVSVTVARIRLIHLEFFIIAMGRISRQ